MFYVLCRSLEFMVSVLNLHSYLTNYGTTCKTEFSESLHEAVTRTNLKLKRERNWFQALLIFQFYHCHKITLIHFYLGFSKHAVVGNGLKHFIYYRTVQSYNFFSLSLCLFLSPTLSWSLYFLDWNTINSIAKFKRMHTKSIVKLLLASSFKNWFKLKLNAIRFILE